MTVGNSVENAAEEMRTQGKINCLLLLHILHGPSYYQMHRHKGRARLRYWLHNIVYTLKHIDELCNKHYLCLEL